MSSNKVILNGGCSHYSINETEKFLRSFKTLAKKHKRNNAFIPCVTAEIDKLRTNPKIAQEPLPAKLFRIMPPDLGFFKSRFSVSNGTSGQIRLMYLVDDIHCNVILLWIYSHEDFAKRPPDKDLTTLIKQELAIP